MSSIFVANGLKYLLEWPWQAPGDQVIWVSAYIVSYLTVTSALRDDRVVTFKLGTKRVFLEATRTCQLGSNRKHFSVVHCEDCRHLRHFWLMQWHWR
jgi:hypothetical protein